MFPADAMPSAAVSTLTSNAPAGPIIHLARGALRVAALPYAAIVRARNGLYDHGVLRSHDLGRPTISVGNLTTGGTGKTPVVAYLTRHLDAIGYTPTILLRGYKAVDGFSDEREELAALLPAIPVVANPNRVAAARAWLRFHKGTDAFVLDDGFQHRRARRELNVVLVSATQGLSSGYVLPRGLLREPASGLRRADVLILTRVDQVEPERLGELERQLEDIAPKVPRIRCIHAPREIRRADYPGCPMLAVTADVLAAEAPLAIAGTGDPAAFHRTLRDLGARIGTTLTYPDHHAYTPADANSICAAARGKGITAIVTTGKDWVKLIRVIPRELRVPVYVVVIAAEFPEADAGFLAELVRTKLPPPQG